MDQIETASVVPYQQNNRTHPPEQIQRIADSIKAFGFNQPIVIDESNTVLVGHGRLLAAQRLKLKTVPVIKLTHLDEAQKRAYRIIDNKLQNDSQWDFDAIEKEIEALQALNFDYSEYGLDDLIITPSVLDSVDIGGEERETDFSRTFTLTKEQVEEVDAAVALAAEMNPDQEGNKNGAAITIIAQHFKRTATE